MQKIRNDISTDSVYVGVEHQTEDNDSQQEAAPGSTPGLVPVHDEMIPETSSSLVPVPTSTSSLVSSTSQVSARRAALLAKKSRANEIPQPMSLYQKLDNEIQVNKKYQ